MVEYWVAYLSVGGQEAPPFFECLTAPAAPIGLVKDVFMLGNAETKDVYIRWHHWFVNNTKLHLVTCTEVELTTYEVRELALQAVKFAGEQCE
jgi:hypothetical protein